MTIKTLDSYDFKTVGTYIDNLFEHIMDKSDGDIVCVAIIACHKDETVAVACPRDDMIQGLLRAALEDRMKNDKAYQKLKKDLEEKLSKIG